MPELTRTAARALMVGIPGPELDAETESRLRDLQPVGLILFGRNLVDAEQTRELLAGFRRIVPGPVLLAVDQEGGRVSRLEPWIGKTPTAADLVHRPAGTVERFGASTGAALRALGFSVDFAPVVDLCREDADNGIGDRSFGIDPGQVTRFAGEFLRGLQGADVAGCLKHFPGLGDTDVDSHVKLPTVRRDAGRLRSEDLLPFRELAGLAASVMVGHGHYPALDRSQRPATCSPPIIEGLLRREIGFCGLVVSDDMEMGAVADRDERGRAAVEALAAGCDLLLYCASLDRAETAAAAIAEAAAARSELADRLRQAVERVARFAEQWSSPASEPLAWAVAARAFQAFRDRA